MPQITDSVSFHLVTEGRCVLQIDGEEERQLQAGDLALVTQGRGHRLLSDPEVPGAERVDLLPQDYLGPQHSRLVHGGGGATSRLICGVVGFDEPAAREMARRLPVTLHIAGAQMAVHSRVLDSIRLMGEELASPMLGGEVVASRLADILVVQAVRVWFLTDPAARSGWFLALSDDRIGRSLQAIHLKPGAPWDVNGLAREARMSRSQFSERFTRLIGETPMAYLTRWRMDVARTRLTEGKATVAQVASEMGYHSEAAFHRAFSRLVGQTPGSFRREALEPSNASTAGTR